MDTAQWPQEIVVKPIEEIVTNTKADTNLERKTRPQKEQALNCPRCNSTNTKFCYYNNYSLTQPRYFCKTCRRYWTEGGSLRNIPVGGVSRKNKRPAPPPSSSKKSCADPNPNIHDGRDLNLGSLQVPNTNIMKNQIIPTCSSQLSAFELFTGISSRGLNYFMPAPDPNTVYTSHGFPMQEFKPTLNFSFDGLGGGYGNVQETKGRILFPFEDLKQVSTTTDHIEQNKDQGDSTGYWTRMIGGGSW